MRTENELIAVNPQILEKLINSVDRGLFCKDCELIYICDNIGGTNCRETLYKLLMEET